MAKVNVSLPDELLGEVDQLAAQLERSRSGLVQEATAHYVAHLRSDMERAARRHAIDDAIVGARDIATCLPAGEDVATLIRRDRDGDYGNVHGE